MLSFRQEHTCEAAAVLALTDRLSQNLSNFEVLIQKSTYTNVYSLPQRNTLFIYFFYIFVNCVLEITFSKSYFCYLEDKLQENKIYFRNSDEKVDYIMKLRRLTFFDKTSSNDCLKIYIHSFFSGVINY